MPTTEPGRVRAPDLAGAFRYAAVVSSSEISREELRQRLHDPQLLILDVLPNESYRSRHIPGALNIPLSGLEARAREALPDQGAEIAIYCNSVTCPIAEQAIRALQTMGYRNLRHYRGGITEWVESGERVETGDDSAQETIPPRHAPSRPRRSRSVELGNAILDRIEERSTSELFALWLALAAVSGLLYWIIGLLPGHGLTANGRPIPFDVSGLLTAVYFSFVSITSVGYGDVLPHGLSRALAIVEAALGLLVFGALVSKFVSRRQEQLVQDIARVTFSERLARVQTNLHLVLSEMQAITTMHKDNDEPDERLRARLESAAMVFAGELRTIHDLLHRPQDTLEETTLEALLAGLAAVLRELAELLAALPPRVTRTPTLTAARATMVRLAEEICGECVPHAYTEGLKEWMDRVQRTARRIA